jgi:methionyl-tRNA formyltransferase
MRAMNIVFLATGAIAVPVLRRILADGTHSVTGVITQPDRPAGRNRQLTPSPVRQAAVEAGLDVLAPEKIRDSAVMDWLAARAPDIAVVFAYGQLIPRRVFDFPPHRTLNIHPSLLPLYRGAAPINWALADGHTETGVSIMYIAEAMDAGDILLQQRVTIAPEEDAESLSTRLADLGATLLLDAFRLIGEGHARATPQDHAHATHARRLTKEDGRIDWTLPAAALHNRVRAFQPWPGAYFPEPGGPAGAMVKVGRTRPAAGQGAPGTLLELAADGPVVAAGEGAVQLLALQPAGKRMIPGPDFVRGCRWAPGTVLD